MDNSDQMLGGFVNQVKELDEQDGFHNVGCFTPQICPHVQETVMFIWRTEGNRR
ncbi:MAG TPA: hypothetical protein VHE59_09250 [Mucilaginibacter sp.]|nr:hypothetical protein [Mucilaginibacter sp.]